MEEAPNEIHICRYDILKNKGHHINVGIINDTEKCGNYLRGMCSLDQLKCVDYVYRKVP